MAGTTSPLAFPYPTGTDRVADGDNAMQALAEAVDDYLTPNAVGFTTVATGNGWTGSVIYAKRAGVVSIGVYAGKATWAGNDVMHSAVLPVGFRPGFTVVGFAVNAAGDGTMRAFSISPDGSIKAAMAGTVSLWGNQSYIVGG